MYEYYKNAVEQKYIDKTNHKQDYYERIRLLVYQTISQMAKSKREDNTNAKIMNVERISKQVWNEHQKEFADLVKNLSNQRDLVFKIQKNKVLQNLPKINEGDGLFFGKKSDLQIKSIDQQRNTAFESQGLDFGIELNTYFEKYYENYFDNFGNEIVSKYFLESVLKIKTDYKIKLESIIRKFQYQLQIQNNSNELTKHIMSHLANSECFCSNQLENYRIMLKLIFRHDLLSKSNECFVFINNKFYQFLSQMPDDHHSVHYNVIDYVKSQLATENILEINIRDLKNFDPKILVDYKPLYEVIDQLIGKIRNDANKRIVRQYWQFMIVYCVYIFRSNLVKALTQCTQRLRAHLHQPKKYDFQIEPVNFDGQEIILICNKISFLLCQHLIDFKLKKIHKVIKNSHDEIRHKINILMDQVTTPSGCIRTIKREILQSLISDKPKNRIEQKLFVRRLIYTAANLPVVIKEHVSKIFKMKKVEFTNFIRKKIRIKFFEFQILEQAFFYEKTFLMQNLNNFGRLFCNLPFALNQESNSDSQNSRNSINSQDFFDSDNFENLADKTVTIYRHEQYKIELQNGLIKRIYNDCIKDIFQTISRFITNQFDDDHSEINNQIYSQIIIDNDLLSEYKKICLDLFDFCGQRCPNCHGTCINRTGHESGDHKFYHIPKILTGKLGSYSLISRSRMF